MKVQRGRRSPSVVDDPLNVELTPFPYSEKAVSQHLAYWLDLLGTNWTPESQSITLVV
jgi:hypothetical protein